MVKRKKGFLSRDKSWVGFFSHYFSLTTLRTIININISKEMYYCKVSISYSLVWVITDAWYFLLKAVWLYQLKCWSGDFSLSEWSRDQQYPRYLCNITPDMCFSLHHLHTDLPTFRSLERPHKVHIGVADPGPGWCKIVMWCDITILWYWRISAG